MNYCPNCCNPMKEILIKGYHPSQTMICIGCLNGKKCEGCTVELKNTNTLQLVCKKCNRVPDLVMVPSYYDANLITLRKLAHVKGINYLGMTRDDIIRRLGPTPDAVLIKLFEKIKSLNDFMFISTEEYLDSLNLVQLRRLAELRGLDRLSGPELKSALLPVLTPPDRVPFSVDNPYDYITLDDRVGVVKRYYRSFDYVDLFGCVVLYNYPIGWKNRHEDLVEFLTVMTVIESNGFQDIITKLQLRFHVMGDKLICK